jgi:hypothetical protein
MNADLRGEGNSIPHLIREKIDVDDDRLAEPDTTITSLG